MALRPRLARLSFSTRFALVLVLLGGLVAGAVVAIPLAQGSAESRQAALDRVADQISLALGLFTAEQRGLSAFADQSGRAASTAADRQAVLLELSRATTVNDVVGIAGGGQGLAASDGRLLDPADGAWLVSAAPLGRTLVADPAGRPWLLGLAAVPGEGAVAFVARALARSWAVEVSLAAHAGGPVTDVAVVRGDRYALDSAAQGSARPAGAAVDPALAPVATRDGPSQIVHATGGDLAAASADLGSGFRVLITSSIPGTRWLSDVVPTIVVTGALVLLGLLLVYRLVQLDLRRPLLRLQQAMEAMAADDFEAPVDGGGDEALVRLSRSFVAVRAELRSLLRTADARAAIAEELSVPTSVDSALRMVCERLRQGCGAQLALVAVRGEDGRRGAVHAAGGPMPDRAETLLDGGGVIAAAAALPVITAILACPLPGAPEATMGLGEVCAAPLTIGGSRLGALAIGGHAGIGDPHGRELVEAAAEQVSLALERERVLVMARLQASTDSLTGLYNRRFLTDFLQQQVAIADRSGSTFSVVMLDVDHFKAINDTHGHEEGDAALRAVADALSRTLRRSDLAARLGGDEFLVVMSDTGLHAAAGVAEKLRRAVAEVTLEPAAERRVRLSVSVGVAARAPGGLGVDGLLTLVDGALYDAKREGRDRVRLADGAPSRSPGGEDARRR